MGYSKTGRRGGGAERKQGPSLLTCGSRQLWREERPSLIRTPRRFPKRGRPGRVRMRVRSTRERAHTTEERQNTILARATHDEGSGFLTKDTRNEQGWGNSGSKTQGPVRGGNLRRENRALEGAGFYPRHLSLSFSFDTTSVSFRARKKVCVCMSVLLRCGGPGCRARCCRDDE